MLWRRQDRYQFVCMSLFVWGERGLVFSIISNKTLINQDSINTNFKFPEYSCYLLLYEKYSQILLSDQTSEGNNNYNGEDLGPRASHVPLRTSLTREDNI